MKNSTEPDAQLPTEQIEHLQQTLRILEAFIAEITFEVRTPSTVIVGYSDVLLEKKIGPLTEEQRKGLVSINQSGKFVFKVWNDLFIMSQVLFNQTFLSIEETDVGELIQEAISGVWEHWQLTYTSDRPVLEQKIPDRLPNIWVDPERVQQAIQQLIVASIRAAAYREDSKLVLTSSFDEDWVIFKIITTGKEVLHFNPQPNPNLFFSQLIIEKHGGHLSIEKEEEFELVVSFRLPIHQNEPTSKKRASE